MAIDKVVDSTSLNADLTDIANAIRAKAGTSAQLTFPEDFISGIENIPSGEGGVVPENDVEFIDYDGTILYSYTKSEFLALTDMPATPTLDGFTSQGWNWDLADAKTYVTAYGGLIIGHQCITADENTYITVSITSNTLSPTIALNFLGTLKVNWGDNSQEDELVSSSAIAVKRLTHTYAQPGVYKIKLDFSQVTEVKYIGRSGFAYIFCKSDGSSIEDNAAYNACVTEIALGKGTFAQHAFGSLTYLKKINIPYNTTTTVHQNCFYNCFNLNGIVFSKTITSLNANAFSNCLSLKKVSYTNNVAGTQTNAFEYTGIEKIFLPDRALRYVYSSIFTYTRRLKRIVIPNSITQIQSSAFNNDDCLKTALIGTGITTIGSSAFYSCKILSEVTIPEAVRTIEANAFAVCKGLGEIHFKGTTPPTITAASAFSGLPTTCKIYVPTGYLADYTSATNYPDPNTYTYLEE